MTYDGPAFYDDDAIFNTYMASRNRTENPNDTLEKPIILELAGDLTNRRILDLGCGDAAFGREALAKGCQTYLGIEGSHNMVEAARQALAGTTGKVMQARIEDWDFPTEAFDLVVSRLVFHYLKDVDAVLEQIYQTLIRGGRLVFSVEHPVITSCDRGWLGNGPRQDWVVDNYFHTGQRITSWLGGQIVKYHRTVENYFVGLQQAGFVVESVREAEPQRERFEQDNTYRRRQRIPLFLIMAGQKHSTSTGNWPLTWHGHTE
ncbi:MAG: methyltransferase domain-containing protein [Chloroflexota bacterium]